MKKNAETFKWRGKLFAAGSDAKTIKSQKVLSKSGKPFITAIMYLAPYDLSGVNVCPMAGSNAAGCAEGCLNSAGHGRFSNVQKARIAKTAFFNLDPKGFIDAMSSDIERFASWAYKKGLEPVIRPNGTSDIRWERYGIIEQFPELQWYDYSKLHNRKGLPDNYHLTWSYSEATHAYAERFDAVTKTLNAAVVFKGKTLPKTFKGLPVLDGDKSDLRHLDPAGHVVGLLAKGKAKSDTSGFVVDTKETTAQKMIRWGLATAEELGVSSYAL